MLEYVEEWGRVTKKADRISLKSTKTFFSLLGEKGEEDFLNSFLLII